MNQTHSVKQQLVDTLVQTGKAHHQAFEATNGEDADWPIWYADRLQPPLAELFDAGLTRSQLVYCLMDAEFERAARADDAEWAPYYADHLLERYAAAQTPLEDKLTLYHFESCPFCVRVRATIGRLGLDVEMRDIRTDPKHWDELVAVRGRGTVPVLKIDSPDGAKRWMPESADIIRYLDKSYG